MLCMTLTMAAQNESQTEYNFLRLPVSAHVAATGGDNVTMIEDDAMLMFSNPALLLGATPKTVSLGYMNYMSGCNYASACYNVVIEEKWNIGVGAQYMNYGKMSERNAEGVELGTFSASDLAVSGTLAYELAKNLSGGVTAKIVYGNIGNYNSLAVAADLGLNYYDPEHEWSLGFVARNLGGQVKSYDENFERMPIDWQIGVSKRLGASPLKVTATMVDLGHWDYKLIDHLCVGAELQFSDQLYVAGGYNFRRAREMRVADIEGNEGSHGAGISLGAGILLERFKVNVAYSKYHVSSSAIVANVAFNL